MPEHTKPIHKKRQDTILLTNMKFDSCTSK